MPALCVTALRWVADRRSRNELAKTTAVYYRRILIRFAEYAGPERPIASLRRCDVEDWVATLKVSAATQRLYLTVVQVFTAWCCAAGYVRKDPALDVKGPQPRRTMPRRVPPEVCKAILSACVDNRERLMVSLAYMEALRVGEIARIEMGDVDWHARMLLVRGKGGHERTVPISGATWRAIDRYLDGRSRTAGPLIRSVQNGMEHRGIGPGAVSRIVSEIMSRVDAGESGHGLRHTAAIETLESGAHVRQVQHMLGHANVQTTSRYLGPVDAEGLRRFMDRRAS